MNEELILLLAEDNEGHASLVIKNLKRAGVINPIIRFKDGEEILQYLFEPDSCFPQEGISYLLLLDIRMPGIDGIEVLKRIKADPVYKKMPVIMLTTTDDPSEIEQCHLLGCSNYITKPIDYNDFVEAIKQLGLFLKVVAVPNIKGTDIPYRKTQ